MSCVLRNQQTSPGFDGNLTFEMKLFLQADTVIGGYEIPKGSIVVRVGHSMSNSAENFVEPDKFLPERYS